LPLIFGRGGRQYHSNITAITGSKGYKEGKLGAINGAVIGAVTALVAWVWYGNPYLGVVIGLGMMSSWMSRVRNSGKPIFCVQIIFKICSKKEQKVLKLDTIRTPPSESELRLPNQNSAFRFHPLYIPLSPVGSRFL
jgi:hypothetical protein